MIFFLKIWNIHFQFFYLFNCCCILCLIFILFAGQDLAGDVVQNLKEFFGAMYKKVRCFNHEIFELMPCIILLFHSIYLTADIRIAGH